MTLTDSKRDGPSQMGQSLTSSWEHVFYTFLIKNTGKFVHGVLPRPSPGLAGTAHFGMTQTLFRDYWKLSNFEIFLLANLFSIKNKTYTNLSRCVGICVGEFFA